jgi:hypothetical protein
MVPIIVDVFALPSRHPSVNGRPPPTVSYRVSVVILIISRTRLILLHPTLAFEYNRLGDNSAFSTQISLSKMGVAPSVFGALGSTTCLCDATARTLAPRS